MSVIRAHLVILILGLPAFAFAAFPKAQGLVTDAAGILDAKVRAELSALLTDVEKRSGAEIAVVTVPSLDGMTVEDYAIRLFKTWGIGKKGPDNGVLILVAPAERKMRIEVGYGLEPVLPDGLAGEIIRTSFLPRFKKDDYKSGIRDGVARVASIVQANHALTADERHAMASRGRPPVWVMAPIFALFITACFFFVGLASRIKVAMPLLVGLFFGGLALLLALAPPFNAMPLMQGAVALTAIGWGYRKGASLDWIVKFRRPPADGSPIRRWISGDIPVRRRDSHGRFTGSFGRGGWSRSSSSGSSSSGGFGGGSSGGGGASGSW